MDQPQPGVDVAADRLDAQAEAERGELRGAARGAGADDRAGGQLAEGEAVAGDERVAGVLAHRDRGDDQAGSGATGRSLSECTARSISPRCKAFRMAKAKTPVPPMVASGAVEVSPKVVISTSSTWWPSARSWSATHPAWVVARVLRRVPSRITPVGAAGGP